MKSVKSVTAASAMVLLSLSLAGPVFADEETVDDSRGGEYNSQGQIQFVPDEKGTNPIDPVDPDPENPIKPIDPIDPDREPNPGTAGPLSIDFASSFNFGENVITTSDMSYFAAYQEFTRTNGESSAVETGPNFVQVTDNRGSEAGWTLMVRQNGQFITAPTDTHANQELRGAQVILKNNTLSTPSQSGVVTKSDNNLEVPITPDADMIIMSAKEGSGSGTHLLRWEDDAGPATTERNTGVELTVPGTSTKYATTYSTTFTWTLTDVPGTGAIPEQETPDEVEEP